ncbi:RING finger and transmembrane domain-containing protein 2 [Mactra antiquata]
MANNDSHGQTGNILPLSDRHPQRRPLWNLPRDMNALSGRLARNQRVQRHLGQVVRGVIPGVNPQPEYHPNPYLEHLYNQNRSEGHDEGHVSSDDLDIADIEAQLQEVIAQNDALDADGEHNTNDNAHGHTHGNPLQRRPLQLDWKLLLSSVSFAIILALRLMIDHILGILVFIGLSTVFYYANNNMIEIVHITSLRESQSKRSVKLSCIWLILFLAAQICGIYWFFSDQDLWKVYTYHLPAIWTGDIFDLFWITTITDYVVRFGTIVIKSVIAVCPLICLPQKRKGKCYMFIEMVSQTYRLTLPILPWVHYLYDHPKSARLIVAAILSVIYICLKAWSLLLGYFNITKAFKTLLNDTKFGTQPTAEDIKSRGENCPICQDDYQDPIMLSCKHIFCENCVSIWFDREKTCPMCRAEIQADSPVWQDGSTSPHYQWY